MPRRAGHDDASRASGAQRRAARNVETTATARASCTPLEPPSSPRARGSTSGGTMNPNRHPIRRAPRRRARRARARDAPIATSERIGAVVDARARSRND